MHSVILTLGCKNGRDDVGVEDTSVIHEGSFNNKKYELKKVVIRVSFVAQHTNMTLPESCTHCAQLCSSDTAGREPRYPSPLAPSAPGGSAAVQITVKPAQNHRYTLYVSEHKIFNTFRLYSPHTRLSYRYARHEALEGWGCYPSRWSWFVQNDFSLIIFPFRSGLLLSIVLHLAVLSTIFVFSFSPTVSIIKSMVRIGFYLECVRQLPQIGHRLSWVTFAAFFPHTRKEYREIGCDIFLTSPCWVTNNHPVTFYRCKTLIVDITL